MGAVDFKRGWTAQLEFEKVDPTRSQVLTKNSGIIVLIFRHVKSSETCQSLQKFRSACSSPSKLMKFCHIPLLDLLQLRCAKPSLISHFLILKRFIIHKNFYIQQCKSLNLTALIYEITWFGGALPQSCLIGAQASKRLCLGLCLSLNKPLAFLH